MRLAVAVDTSSGWAHVDAGSSRPARDRRWRAVCMRWGPMLFRRGNTRSRERRKRRLNGKAISAFFCGSQTVATCLLFYRLLVYIQGINIIKVEYFMKLSMLSSGSPYEMQFLPWMMAKIFLKSSALGKMELTKKFHSADGSYGNEL